jgi:hypothetical protein
MSYSNARLKFDEAIAASQNAAATAIAEGLKEMAQTLQNDISKIERELRTIGNRVNSIR